MPRLQSNENAIDPKSTAILQQIQALRILFRIELSAMVALSAFAGYLFAGGLWNELAGLAALGTGLLAAGCSALNQWQEQDVDQLMERTKKRPLPAGFFSSELVLVLASVHLGSGLLLLAKLPGMIPLQLGVLAIIWYNAIYTPLKRKTPFAAIPGAICGALPPLIGWTAAGGFLITQKSIILAGTLFIWQIPHTWLLYCRYRDDLRLSGLPDLLNVIPTSTLLRINNCWLMSLFLCYLLFPLFNYIQTPTLSIAFIISIFTNFYFIFRTSKAANSPITAGHSFHLVNISMALLLTTLIFDKL